MRNLYKVLGIASTADAPRIKSAFRRRALTTHPDLNPGNNGAEERFRELMQAYEVLRDAHARAAYDAQLAQQRSQARWHFVQSAAVMVVTFVLTTSSAIFVAGLQGINVHSETWHNTTAWLTSVEVEPSGPSDRLSPRPSWRCRLQRPPQCRLTWTLIEAAGLPMREPDPPRSLPGPWFTSAHPGGHAGMGASVTGRNRFIAANGEFVPSAVSCALIPARVSVTSGAG